MELEPEKTTLSSPEDNQDLEAREPRLAQDEDVNEEEEQLEPQERKRTQVSVCLQKQSQIYLQSVEQKISSTFGALYKVLCRGRKLRRAGTPNLDTQVKIKAGAQASEVMEDSKTASGHLEVLSIIFKR